MDKSRARRKPTGRRAIAFARTREEIMMAAARALARSGFNAVSMSDIAEEVGFTAPAIYAYFDSKEAIFAELLRTLNRELAETFEPPPAPDLTFRQRVAVLARRQLEWTDRRRDVFVAFMALHGRGEAVFCARPRGQKARPPNPEDHLRRLAKWLGRAADKPGDLGGHDVHDAAAVLMGIAHGFFLRWLTAATRAPLASRTDQILDFFFHGLGGPPQRGARPGPRN